MPRTSKGARLLYRRRRTGGIYFIRDGSRQLTTGTGDRREAETALAAYIAERDRPASGPRDPSQITVAEILERYASEHAPHVKDPARIGHAVGAIVPILGRLPVSHITGEICRRYAKARGRAPGTVRKELGTLQAALNYCHAEGYLTAAPRVRLPAKPAPRDRWLTRDEAAKLIRAAYRDRRTRHVARFILVALGTGTRSDAILRMRFTPSIDAGWIDLERGLMHRRGMGEAETKKRQPPVPLPRRLLAHLRRWDEGGAHHVVEYEGSGRRERGRVASVKHAWASALAASGIGHCTRHDLRRTAVTWAMQNGIDKWAACGFFGLTMDVLESTYGHHHPEYLRSAVEAIERRRA